MATIDERLVSKVVSEVLLRLQSQNGTAQSGGFSGTQYGVYEKMEDAINAAYRSFEKLRDLGMHGRRLALAEIRRLCVEKAEEWGKIEFAETKIGREDHKIGKLKICGDLVPGVEYPDRLQRRQRPHHH